MIPQMLLMIPQAVANATDTVTRKASESGQALIDPITGVDLSQHTQEETYAIARALMDVDKFLLSLVGLEHNQSIFNVVYAVLVFFLAMVVGWITQAIVIAIVRKVGKHLKSDLYAGLRQKNFFTKTTQIIPAIFFLILIQFTLSDKQTLMMWLSKFCYIWITYIVARSICILAEVVWQHIDVRANKKKLPLRGLVQLVKGVVWIICAIIIVAVLCNKSPGSLLAGLGAFAAVLMLVFKDSILGIVAGVQLSENDSLHVGDWIAVQGTNANGTVMEVSLTQVKIMNWDKTVTTVPPYNLISGSFTNYRTMQESHTRRIVRCYMLDADSVVEADETMLEEFRKIPLLKDWIDKKVEQRNAGQVCDANNPAGLVDGSLETNLGIFRAYLRLWLQANRHIDPNSDCFVTTLQQTSNGIPLQMYCFTATSAWFEYEAIMAAMFEHIAVMLAKFRLYTFEAPTGRDTIIDGYLSPGKNPDVLFGMPYPFYMNTGSPSNPCYPPQNSAHPQPQLMTPLQGAQPSVAAPSQGNQSSGAMSHPASVTPSPSQK